MTHLTKNLTATDDGSIAVDISYDIIRHVSAQLYTSPRKAIEELVCNAYDAGATECHVVLPEAAGDPLLVLDNGVSMDLEGLRGLWKVASSPKAETLDKQGRRVANGRMQIGKFGVGKLAAFALGDRLTHIACTAGTVRVISVDQDKIKDAGNGRAPRFHVQRLTSQAARTELATIFDRLPSPWTRKWPHWTVAVVEDIDESARANALKIGILKRMIKTALPLSAKFSVSLQGANVPLRSIDAIVDVTVNLTDVDFCDYLRTALQSYWATLLDVQPDDVPPEKFSVSVIKATDPHNTTKTVSAITVSGLGPVSGTAVATTTSLATEKREERGYYDNGFAVTCLGKLINPEDPLFGITQRSHKYWTRFLAQVEIPGLDEVLLVQRNAISEHTPQAQITRELLRALFNYTRRLVEAKEKGPIPTYVPGTFGYRLGTSSPILAQAALRGLFGEGFTASDLPRLAVNYSTLGVATGSTQVDLLGRAILVNEDHPLITALDELGEVTKPMRLVVSEVLAGITFAEGYLKTSGVDTIIISDVRELIDASLRSAASFVLDPVEQHIKDIEDASQEGGTRFERAVVAAFQSLRLVAHRIGESDRPDGIVEIPMSGRENLRISIEAKGSHGRISHSVLSSATVERHSGDYACQHAVAIAREYVTDGISGKNSALIRETQGKIPLLTTDGIAQMLRRHKERNFTYDKVVKILTTWKHPDELVQFVEDVWQELPEPGLMRLILTVAHELVTDDATNLPDPGMIVADSRVRKRKIKREEVVNILMSVQLTTRMLTIIDMRDYRFELNAPVQTILDAMQAHGGAPSK